VPRRKRGQGERLRPLGWHELCARLVAAQDLRKAVKQALPGSTTLQGGASFHGLAARLLTGGENVETPVNPTRSTNGKAEGGTLPAKQTPPSPCRAELIDEYCHDREPENQTGASYRTSRRTADGR
jgi:hypothetical protein